MFSSEELASDGQKVLPRNKLHLVCASFFKKWKLLIKKKISTCYYNYRDDRKNGMEWKVGWERDAGTPSIRNESPKGRLAVGWRVSSCLPLCGQGQEGEKAASSCEGAWSREQYQRWATRSEVGNKVRSGSPPMKALCARLRSLDFISQDTDDAELCYTGPHWVF